MYFSIANRAAHAQDVTAGKDFEKESANKSFQIQIKSKQPIISTSFRHADALNVVKKTYNLLMTNAYNQ